jgi:hypothetical protein
MNSVVITFPAFQVIRNHVRVLTLRLDLWQGLTYTR